MAGTFSQLLPTIDPLGTGRGWAHDGITAGTRAEPPPHGGWGGGKRYRGGNQWVIYILVGEEIGNL